MVSICSMSNSYGFIAFVYGAQVMISVILNSNINVNEVVHCELSTLTVLLINNNWESLFFKVTRTVSNCKCLISATNRNRRCFSSVQSQLLAGIRKLFCFRWWPHGYVIYRWCIKYLILHLISPVHMMFHCIKFIRICICTYIFTHGTIQK